MYSKDDKITSFKISLKVYGYNIIPFGLKNANTTEQHLMNIIFHEQLQKKIENVMLMTLPSKIEKKQIIFKNLKVVFDLMKKIPNANESN